MPLELEVVGAALDRLGYPARPVPGEPELSVEIADNRGLDPAESARSMAVRCMSIAGSAGTASEMRMLTFSTSYPFSAPLDALGDARLAAAEVTQYLVLGHVEVDDDGSPHVRYSMLVEASSVPSDALLTQLVSLLDYEQLHFGDYLQALFTGDATIEVFAELVARGEASGID